MKALLLVFSAIQVLHGYCPDGFDIVQDGQCRGLYSTLDVDFSQTVATAVTECKKFGAEPVIIHNAEDEAYWVGQRKWSKFVLGLVCNRTSNKWQWVDGSPVDYKPEAGYNHALDETCANTNSDYSWELTSYSQWTLTGPSHPNQYTVSIDIFCAKQLQPVPPQGGCYGFDDDVEDGPCYMVGAPAQNWQDAQLICKHLGATLTSIHNDTENSFIERTAVANGATDGIFLGASRSGEGADFVWVDGSKWDYQNFTAGFPMKNAGNCLAMDTSKPAKQWQNNDCSASLPVACMREKKAAWNVSEASCAYDSYEEGALITSPGFPFNASLECEYYLTADPGKAIEVEIISLEANSCCDYLEIHDGFLGVNMIANLTGSIRNATYTGTSSSVRVAWQPNGGVNVQGFAMTFRAV